MTDSMDSEQPFARLMLFGGLACLDFCNTVEYHDLESRHEWLKDYSGLALWSLYAHIISEGEAGRLLGMAEQSPDAADAVFRQALALREAMYQIFKARFKAEPIPQDSAAILNSALPATLSHLQLATPTDSEFVWAWEDSGALDRILWPTVRSAADLLTSDTLARVHQCPGCGWFFVDESKNHSRTWCDMRFCGNRAKRKRHYQRSKTEG